MKTILLASVILALNKSLPLEDKFLAVISARNNGCIEIESTWHYRFFKCKDDSWIEYLKRKGFIVVNPKGD